MSEFSESYHLRTNNKDDGIALLNKMGARGIVFEQTNGWITVLPEGELNSQIGNVSSSFSGVVLHYMYAEDHAWMMNLFSNGLPISRFLCMWDPEFNVQDDSLNVDAFADYLQSPDTMQEFEKLFAIDNLEDLFEVNPAYKFADLLGIEHYQWLGGHDLPSHADDILQNVKEAVLVE